MRTPVEVYFAGDIIEANAVCEELAEAGIEAVVVGDHLQNAVGDLPFTVVGPRVWVADDDAMRGAPRNSRMVSPAVAHRRASTKQSLFQFSFKDVFVLITIAAILAPILRLMGGTNFISMFAGLLFYSLFGTLLVVAYRKKTAWRHEAEAVETDATESPPSDDPARNC